MQPVQQLPEKCRLIFKMVKEDSLSFREVAEILHISPRTVETQIYRAVKKLKVVLTHQPGQPDAEQGRQRGDRPDQSVADRSDPSARHGTYLPGELLLLLGIISQLP